MSGAKSLTVQGADMRVIAILIKWFSLTRLETRTKESNIYASIWVFKTLMRNESEGRIKPTEVGSFAAQSTDLCVYARFE